MKRFLCVMVCVALLLAGCGPAAGTLAPKRLTAGEEALVKMLDFEQELYLFSVNTGEKYRHVYVWAEVYEDGALTYQGEDVASGRWLADEQDEPQAWQGTILIGLLGGERDRLYVAFRDKDGDLSTDSPLPLPAIDNDRRSWYPAGSSEASLTLSPEKEVVLFADVVEREGEARLGPGDLQRFAQDAKFVGEFEAVRLIKCCFV